MLCVILPKKMTKKEHDELINNGEFQLIGFQYTIMYMFSSK